MAKTTKRTTKRERTAAEAYAERTAEIEKLLAAIKGALDVHANDFRAAGSTNWGYVGDLGFIAHQLRDAAISLDGNLEQTLKSDS